MQRESILSLTNARRLRSMVAGRARRLRIEGWSLVVVPNINQHLGQLGLPEREDPTIPDQLCDSRAHGRFVDTSLASAELQNI